MTDSRQSVLPVVTTRTEADVRRALSRDLNRLCVNHGVQRVGLTIGCDEKTVRNARDEATTLKLHTALNLLVVDHTALDTLLAEYGLRVIPCNASDMARHASNVMAKATASTTAMTDPDSPAGTAIIAQEIAQHEDDIRASHRLTGWMLSLLDQHRGHGLRSVA